MNAKDQVKVLKAGFTIIRKEVIHMVSHNFIRKIIARTPERMEWHTLEGGFENMTLLQRRMKELLAGTMIIED